MITRSQTKQLLERTSNRFAIKNVRTRSHPKVVYFEDTYDFDEASSAWRANKRSNGNGSFRYICAGSTRTGRPCQRTARFNSEFCVTHTVVESDAPYQNTRRSTSLRSKW
jgi:hypothetical protein